MREQEWRGTCREWYTLEVDVRSLKHFIGGNPSELDYIKVVGNMVSSTLNTLHYNYFERGEKFICDSSTSMKRVPPDAQANFSYVGNISYFYICNKAIIEVSFDEMTENDVTFTLTITAPCYIVRDFLKNFISRAFTVGMLVV